MVIERSQSVQYAEESERVDQDALQKTFSQDRLGSTGHKKVLILVAHPNVHGKSLSHALANTAVDNLAKYGDEVRVVDLFKIKFGFGGRADFKETLHSEETFDYQWEQRVAAEGNMDNFSHEVREQIENLMWADVIMYVFPMYWFHVPAVLKAWQDRVFAWHLTYGGDKNLKGKQFLTVVSCGASADVFKNVFSTTPEDVLKGFSVAPSVLMGAKVLPTYVVYNAHGKPEEKQQRHEQFCADFEKYLNAHRSLDGEEPCMVATSYPLESLTSVPAQYEDDLNNVGLAISGASTAKKHVLILLAHNNFKGDSLNHDIAKKAEELCKDAGHAVRFVDLNAINFGIGGVDDFKTLMYDDTDFDYQWEQRTAAEKDPCNFSPELQEQIDNLKWADLVVFQFPMYWFHMPAIMKAWIDRVLVWHLFYGAGFNLQGKSFFFSTTLGMSEDIVKKVFNTSVPDLYKGLNEIAPKLTKAKALPMYINYESNGPADEKSTRHPPMVSAFEQHFLKYIL